MSLAKYYRPLLEPGGSLISDTVTITRAQMLLLMGTPIALTDTPPDNYYIVLCESLMKKPAGEGYTIGLATGIAIKYENAGGTELGRFTVTGSIDQATLQYRLASRYRASSLVTAVEAYIAPTIEVPLVANMLTANVTNAGAAAPAITFKTVYMLLPYSM